MQSRQWDSTVFNDAEEAQNRGNQIESKQPFLFYSEFLAWLNGVSNGCLGTIRHVSIRLWDIWHYV